MNRPVMKKFHFHYWLKYAAHWFSPHPKRISEENHYPAKRLAFVTLRTPSHDRQIATSLAGTWAQAAAVPPLQVPRSHHVILHYHLDKVLSTLVLQHFNPPYVRIAKVTRMITPFFCHLFPLLNNRNKLSAFEQDVKTNKFETDWDIKLFLVIAPLTLLFMCADRSQSSCTQSNLGEIHFIFRLSLLFCAVLFHLNAGHTLGTCSPIVSANELDV